MVYRKVKFQDLSLTTWRSFLNSWANSSGDTDFFLWSATQISIEAKRHTVWAAFDERNLYALIVLQEIDELWEILFLGTHPDFRKLGFMSDLLETLLLELPAGGRLWLEVHERNIPARNFYAKHGFKPDGRRPNYYRDGGAAILYSWENSQRTCRF